MSVILVTAGYDHKIRFWEAPSGICCRALLFPDSQVNRLEITRDKAFLAAAGNPSIRIFEVNGAPGHVMACEGHVGAVTGLGFHSMRSWMYSCSEDGTVKVWDLRGPGYQRSFDCGSPCGDVVLPGDGDDRTLVSCDAGGSIRFWDLGMGKNTIEICPERGTTEELLVASDDNNIVSKGEPTVRHDPKPVAGLSRSVRPAIGGRPKPLQALDISEDGRLLCALSSRGTVYAYALAPGNRGDHLPVHLTTFQAHRSYATAARISPDGRHLVTCGADRTARLWNTSSSDEKMGNSGSSSVGHGVPWTCAGTLDGHGRWVWDAAFSADSSYLVTASSDYSSRLWNLRTGEVVRQYAGHAGPVTCVALNDSSP
mmetsp:Transcript_247/g.541  ORF Transcript_247/g.541 Transcript_247/m.541 type:complete len:369 (-) Transcript_247:603-1709(-)